MNTQHKLPTELENAPSWAREIYYLLPPLVTYRDLSSHVHLAKGTLANLCSKSKGPNGGMIIGNKKLFPRLDIVLWILERVEYTQQKS